MDMSAFDDISEETKARAIACKTPEEILELAKSEGVELSLEELDSVSGGGFWSGKDAPNTGPSCDTLCAQEGL